ncbi:MAG: GIY-YIG nuclease family protein [Endomicrobiales bacterium]|nr:GIY-YIG nuclease family protein [Endomicrobiales bacterium]
MKYTVYILVSVGGKYYIGQTNNLVRRLLQHKNGLSKWSRKYSGWELIYSQEYDTRSQAVRKEREIKSYKGGLAFKKLLNGS